jgi:dipeptidyl aminopeptidase/acylaminoacyl peptidase
VDNDKGWGSPAWQRPAGRCIAYSGERPGGVDRNTDILMKCPDEAARKVVDTAEMDEDGPDWKPDGSQIVYEARVAGLANLEKKLWDLWVVNPDGSGRERLLDEPNTSERQPRWSPDGLRIAFVTYGPAGFGKGILKTLDLATGAVSAHVEGVAGPMAWSPDGKHILFYNTWDGGPKPVAAQAPAQGQVKGLYMLDPETHEITRLLPPAGGEQANDDPPSFEWGYAPDWTAGTYTPTPIASPTPTATVTPSATVTPIISLTPSPSPSATPSATSDEFTPTPRPTDDPSPDIYLPIAYKP